VKNYIEIIMKINIRTQMPVTLIPFLLTVFPVIFVRNLKRGWEAKELK